MQSCGAGGGVKRSSAVVALLFNAGSTLSTSTSSTSSAFSKTADAQGGDLLQRSHLHRTRRAHPDDARMPVGSSPVERRLTLHETAKTREEPVPRPCGRS